MNTGFDPQDAVFQALAMQWFSAKKAKLKASTRSKYLSVYCGHIGPLIGGRKLSEITSDDVNRILTDLWDREDISCSLFNVTRYLLNAMLRFGWEMGCLRNVRLTVESARQTPKNIQILNDDQVKTVLQKADCARVPAHLGIILSLYTGMRLGEVCALKRENVDFKNEVIHVRQTVQRLTGPMGRSALTIGDPKSRSSCREIPVLPCLLTILKKYGVDGLADEKYVLNSCDVPYEPRTLQYGFARFARQCGFQELHYHCLRHTFATRCIRAGMDMKTLSEILGHADVSVTMNIYVHSDMEQKKRQMRLLEADLSGDIS